MAAVETLQFDGPSDLSEFSQLDGVTDVGTQDGRVTFKVTGDLNPMVAVAARPARQTGDTWTTSAT